jgi:hypothetical protein
MLLFFSLLNAHTHTSWNASLWLLRTEHCCLHRVLDLHAETSVFLPVGIKNKIVLHEECYVCQFDESEDTYPCQSASVFGLSNARVVGQPPLSVPAPPMHLFFPFFWSIFAGRSEAVFDFVRTKAAVRQMPAASTNACRHAGEIAGMRGGYTIEYRIAKTNQPDRSTEINVHGHG